MVATAIVYRSPFVLLIGFFISCLGHISVVRTTVAIGRVICSSDSLLCFDLLGLCFVLLLLFLALLLLFLALLLLFLLLLLLFLLPLLLFLLLLLLFFVLLLLSIYIGYIGRAMLTLIVIILTKMRCLFSVMARSCSVIYCHIHSIATIANIAYRAIFAIDLPRPWLFLDGLRLSSRV